jgi:hypothetical protein
MGVTSLTYFAVKAFDVGLFRLTPSALLETDVGRNPAGGGPGVNGEGHGHRENGFSMEDRAAIPYTTVFYL